MAAAERWNALFFGTVLMLLEMQGVDLARAIPIRNWRVLGPFVIGKNELDGKPWHAANVSELLGNGGVVKSQKLTSDSNGNVRVQWPQVQWQELVNTIGGHELLEWQALAQAKFSVKESVRVRIECQGIAAVTLDGQLVPFVGDQYNAGYPGHVVDLEAGTHRITVRMRAKVQAQFRCSAPIQDGASPLLVGGRFLQLPEVVDGVLPSDFVSVLVSNSDPQRWLRNPRFEITDTSGSAVRVELARLGDSQANWPSVAPGQHAVFSVRLRLTGRGCPKTSQLRVQGELTRFDESGIRSETVKSAGLAITLRCRARGQSFVFTFLDDDGSVQHAAAIHPLGPAQCGKDDGRGCPVLVTLHGTSISASDSADAFKVKEIKDKDYRFGVVDAWLLAPTRHGAHNWEGPGRLTALAALRALGSVAAQVGGQAVDLGRAIFAGHSMGGHGAWLLATALPDVALGVASSASWLRKDQYADSNRVLLHDVASADVEPALEAVLKAAEAEFDVEKHAATLATVPVLARVGSRDQTVHPWFSRRMVRTLLANGADTKTTRVVEIPGKEHWWWDTDKSNDGGAVNDPQLRSFFADCLAADLASRYPPTWRLVVFNPATAGAKGGIRVLQQDVPHRRSEITAELRGSASTPVASRINVYLVTANVRRMEWSLPEMKLWLKQAVDAATLAGKLEVHIHVDDDAIEPVLLGSESIGQTFSLCSAGHWQLCRASIAPSGYAVAERSPATYGPMRQLFSAPVCAVVAEAALRASAGTSAAAAAAAALYVANLLPMTGDGQMPLLADSEVLTASGDSLKPPGFCTHLLIVGSSAGAARNRAAAALLRPRDEVGYTPPLHFDAGGVSLGGCFFPGPHVATLALLPWWEDSEGEPQAARLALLASGVGGEQADEDVAAAEAISLLATPTIPPMTRQPLTHLLPDYVVLNVNETHARGPGGFVAAGFWGHNWQYEPRAAWERSCRRPSSTAASKSHTEEL